ncbi:MAG: DUF2007 domain-containing protein [Phycisphaerales bacterium]
MPTTPDQPVAVFYASSEWQANLVASRLDASGIAAQVAGGITGGYRAEAPGSVQVMVRAEDKARAEEILSMPPGAEFDDEAGDDDGGDDEPEAGGDGDPVSPAARHSDA